MRTITVILRLVRDEDDTRPLSGFLQTLEQEDQRPFSDEQELLRLLLQLTAPTHVSPNDSGHSLGMG